MDERRRARIAIVAAAALLASMPGEAGAQFFRLQGVLACIDHPETEACRERLRPAPGQPASASAAAVPAAGAPTAKPLAEPPKRPPPSPPATAPPDGVAPPKPVAPQPKEEASAARFTAADLKDAIARVQANRATGRDMAVLEAKARGDDPAAVEVLAWCKLQGRGAAPDRLAAYRLYGRAVALHVPHARENRRIIFEHLMTDAERRQALAADARAGT